MTNDERFMKKALELAEKGRGFTSPNPMVGAVIVKDGKIIGEGFHEIYGGKHAEVNAIESCLLDSDKTKNRRPKIQNPKGATLYVTLEPCSHHGKTPPCTDAIIKAGIKRVVIAIADPHKASGDGLNTLDKAGVDVRLGVLKEQAEKQNEAFLKHACTGLPFVTLKAASTLDGKIATITGDSKWISCEDSRERVHKLRGQKDAIIVGVGTVLKDDPLLTSREHGKNPIRVILDSKLRIPLDAKVLDKEAETIIATSAEAPEDRIKELLERGAEILKINKTDHAEFLAELIKELGKRDITSVLIEGGAQVNGAALTAGIVDKIILFVSPKIIGEGLPVFKGFAIQRLRDAIKLDSLKPEQVGGDVVLTCYVNKNTT